jgi:Arc/MetJ-type ribon-helix-helix transcriptional regulator
LTILHTKTVWIRTAIPKELVARIVRIAGTLGYPSVAQFIQEAVRTHLDTEENKFEEIRHERDVGRKALGKDEAKDNW